MAAVLNISFRRKYKQPVGRIYKEIPYLLKLRHPLELTHPLSFDLVNIKNTGNDARN